MKTIKSLKDITTLEVGDVVVFGDLKHEVARGFGYFLICRGTNNDKIFEVLNINKRNFIENLGIGALYGFDFPEVKSLEALTAIVSALFKEYEKQDELPKTWEEFCEKYYLKGDEAFITSTSELNTVRESFVRRFRLREEDKNLCISEKEAEAFLALMQLRQLRKAYVKDWEPDLGKKDYYGIIYTYNGIKIESYTWNYRCLSFPTHELATQFLNNFKYLLEIAKPLL
jgi:hypothetical protein